MNDSQNDCRSIHCRRSIDWKTLVLSSKVSATTKNSWDGNELLAVADLVLRQLIH
jgi:hypothetical protein